MHYKIKVIGKVQGVFFRASTQKKASELGLRGFVRNEPDGTVYVEAQGQQVEELINWIKAGGPEMARVDEVYVQEGEGVTFTSGFKVQH